MSFWIVSFAHLLIALLLENMDKSLKEKAISIKGKNYVLVSDRIIFFNENYPNGSIQTLLVSETKDERVVVKAIITPDHDKSQRFFTAYSQAIVGDGYINKSSALENCETSAVGRALAMLGIGVIDSIASVDEINKAGLPQQRYPKIPIRPIKTVAIEKDPRKQIMALLLDLGLVDPHNANKEDCESAVKRQTDLKLTEENYPEIISRLEVLKMCM